MVIPTHAKYYDSKRKRRYVVIGKKYYAHAIQKYNTSCIIYVKSINGDNLIHCDIKFKNNKFPKKGTEFYEQQNVCIQADYTHEIYSDLTMF